MKIKFLLLQNEKNGYEIRLKIFKILQATE